MSIKLLIDPEAVSRALTAMLLKCGDPDKSSEVGYGCCGSKAGNALIREAIIELRGAMEINRNYVSTKSEPDSYWDECQCVECVGEV